MVRPEFPLLFQILQGCLQVPCHPSEHPFLLSLGPRLHRMEVPMCIPRLPGQNDHKKKNTNINVHCCAPVITSSCINLQAPINPTLTLQGCFSRGPASRLVVLDQTWNLARPIVLGHILVTSVSRHGVFRPCNANILSPVIVVRPIPEVA